MRCFGRALLLLLLISLPAFGQENGKVPLVGVLLVNAAANPEPVVPLFRNALAALGYVEGRNLRLDFRLLRVMPSAFRRWPKRWPRKTLR